MTVRRRSSIGRVAPAVMASLLAIAGCGEPLLLPEPDMTTAEEPVRIAVTEAQEAVRAAPDSARAWGELGDRYRAESWIAEAAACYAAAERLEPEAFIWPYRVGKCLRLDDPSGAADAFARALALDDGYAPAHIRYARALASLGRFEEARVHFEQARRLDPGSAAALLGLGQIALSDGRVEEARGQLAGSLQLDPRDGRTHLAMAQAALALGDREAADRHSALAGQLLQNLPLDDPRDLTVESVSTAQLTRRGKQLLVEGKPEEAETFLREALILEPDSAPTRLALGLALVMVGRLDEAEPELREAVRIEPDRFESRSALGKFLLHTRNRPHEGVEQLRAAARLNPDDVDCRLHLGAALAAIGLVPQAEEALREAVSLEPDHPEARYRLGLLLAGVSRPEEAEREFLEVLRITGPADGDGPGGAAIANRLGYMTEAHVSLGYLRLDQGRADEAVRHFTEATGLRPSHALAQLGLGRALVAQGDNRRAETAFRRALQLRPDWSETLRRDLEAIGVAP